jgi:hypothetical protein
MKGLPKISGLLLHSYRRKRRGHENILEFCEKSGGNPPFYHTLSTPALDLNQGDLVDKDILRPASVFGYNLSFNTDQEFH